MHSEERHHLVYQLLNTLQVVRRNVTGVNTHSQDFMFQAAVPTKFGWSTHGGEDIAIFAAGNTSTCRNTYPRRLLFYCFFNLNLIYLLNDCGNKISNQDITNMSLCGHAFVILQVPGLTCFIECTSRAT